MLALCVLCLILVASGQKPEAKPIQRSESVATTHYQRVTARTDDNGTSAEMVLLLDSSRGRVWRYYPPTLSKEEKTFVPEAFQPVGIGAIDLRLPRFGLKDSADEVSEH
jgi:hypothetical protein